MRIKSLLISTVLVVLLVWAAWYTLAFMAFLRHATDSGYGPREGADGRLKIEVHWRDRRVLSNGIPSITIHRSSQSVMYGSSKTIDGVKYSWDRIERDSDDDGEPEEVTDCCYRTFDNPDQVHILLSTTVPVDLEVDHFAGVVREATSGEVLSGPPYVFDPGEYSIVVQDPNDSAPPTAGGSSSLTR